MFGVYSNPISQSKIRTLGIKEWNRTHLLQTEAPESNKIISISAGTSKGNKLSELKP